MLGELPTSRFQSSFKIQMRELQGQPFWAFLPRGFSVELFSCRPWAVRSRHIHRPTAHLYAALAVLTPVPPSPCRGHG